MTREEEILESWNNYRSRLYRSSYIPSDEFVGGFNAGVKWMDKIHAKKQTVTIDAWVARDKNMDLFFGKEYPMLDKMTGTWGGMDEYYPLPQDTFPSVTFENSPKKVKVTIELEEKQ